MSNELKINKLYFGSDDAELDEKRGFLDKVFLKTSIYHRIKGSNRELVIGRKGSGKSAICLMLQKVFKDEGFNVIFLSPESLSKHKIEQLLASSISNDEAYIHIWRYVILIAIGKDILNNIENLQDVDYDKKNIKEIYKFLIKNEEIEKNAIGKFVDRSPILSNFSLKLFGIEGSVTVNQPENQSKFADELEKFQTYIEKALTELYKNQLIVLFDKVDEVWNHSQDSEAMIIGLVRATHDLNLRLRQAQIISFLRSDIYDVLKFHDADKLHSLEERLNWKKEDLKQLIANRGKVSANLEIEDTEQIWNAIFEKRVMNELSFDYLVERTMLRPRELIQFCNQALSEAQDNNHNYIHSEDILNAEKQYAEWKLKDLASEFIVQYPYLDELIGLFQGFKKQFEYEEFIERFRTTKKRLSKKYPDIDIVSSDIMLQILYVIGFLGTAINGEKLFVYNDPTIILSQKESMVIHPSFIAALNLQTNRVVNVHRDYIENVSGRILTGRDSITIGGNASVNSFTTGFSDRFQGDYIQRLIQTITPESSQSDIIKLLSFVQEELIKLPLPEEIKEEALNELKGAEIQAKKDQPNKEKIAGKLENTTEILKESAETTQEAVIIGNLLGKAILWSGKLVD